MIGIIAEIGAFMVAGHMAKRSGARAAAALATAGIQRSGRVDRVVRMMGTHGVRRPHAAMTDLIQRQGTFSNVRSGAQMLGGRSAAGYASDVLRTAAANRGWRAAETLMWAVPMMGLGSQLIGGVGDLAARAPVPSEQLANTQMMMMPRAAFTQRQRSLQAIYSSQTSTRAAIGSEAMFLHG